MIFEWHDKITYSITHKDYNNMLNLLLTSIVYLRVLLVMVGLSEALLFHVQDITMAGLSVLSNVVRHRLEPK